MERTTSKTNFSISAILADTDIRIDDVKFELPSFPPLSSSPPFIGNNSLPFDNEALTIGNTSPSSGSSTSPSSGSTSPSSGSASPTTGSSLSSSSENTSPSSTSSSSSYRDGYAKPPYTYSSLIVMALRNSSEKQLTLSGICDWIAEHFPYYQKNQSSWQNSIRHNLSVSSCFIRLPRALDDPGRGSYWALAPCTEDLTIGETTGRLRRNKSLSGGNGGFTPNRSTYKMHHPYYQRPPHYTPHAVYFPTPEEMEALIQYQEQQQQENYQHQLYQHQLLQQQHQQLLQYHQEYMQCCHTMQY